MLNDILISICFVVVARWIILRIKLPIVRSALGPYLDNWNKHCGGSWWHFSTRTLALGDSALLAFLSWQIASKTKFLGLSLGAGLFSKSTNDMYEAWTGNSGPIREVMGDPIYDAAGYAVMGYGFLRQVPKIGYLGNPKRDFFVRDPNNYEYAFLQYSSLEFLHTFIGTSITMKNDHDKYIDNLSLELGWTKHILRTRQYNAAD
jgi:hypothetical protein